MVKFFEDDRLENCVQYKGLRRGSLGGGNFKTSKLDRLHCRKYFYLNCYYLLELFDLTWNTYIFNKEIVYSIILTCMFLFVFLIYISKFLRTVDTENPIYKSSFNTQKRLQNLINVFFPKMGLFYLSICQHLIVSVLILFNSRGFGRIKKWYFYVFL